MNSVTSVIAAISTPPGKGGVALIRISGNGAIEVGDRVFRPISGKPLSDFPPRYQVRGGMFYGDEEIDDGMAVIFRGPKSYTGEDTVELYCHGGALVTKTVLEAVFAAGARPADKGEFTSRAFINGKLSLVEAEAIGNLLEAESREQIRLSGELSRSLLAQKIELVRELLTSLLSSLYARIDYPDEDLGDFTSDEALDFLNRAKTLIAELKSSYRTGKAINEGIRTVICGKPNVGKSSLYNLLLGRDAAIVTDIKGTTRDVLTEKIPLGRVMLSLSDTAGVREDCGIDAVEAIGIERTHRAISDAELIISVFDLSAPLDCEDLALIDSIKDKSAAKIAVLNKSDLQARLDKSLISKAFDNVIEITTKSDEAISMLSALVDKLFTDEKIKVGTDAVVSSARQNAKLTAAAELIDSAIDAYRMGMSDDAVSSDIERALGEIAELDGRAVSEAVVSDIFSKFCVGK